MPRKQKAFFGISIISLLYFTLFAHADTLEYDGLIDPYEIIEIGSPSQGIVEKVLVDKSSRIEQGQILVELDASVQKVALEKAEAMAKFNGEINLQKTQLAFTVRVHDRFKGLSGVSDHDKDQAATDILLTKNRLKKAKENHILAKFELLKARALLAQKSIKSPIDGVVVEKYVSPGEYVNTQPLLRIARTNPLRVEVIVPAQMYGYIQPGMTATVTPELTAYEKKTAIVSLVDTVIDAASNTFGVRLDLPNPDLEMPGGLKCRVGFEIQIPENFSEETGTNSN